MAEGYDWSFIKNTFHKCCHFKIIFNQNRDDAKKLDRIRFALEIGLK